MLKRQKRSWQLYRLLRKDKWKSVVSCDEAWFYLTNLGGKRSIQYLKEDQSRKEADLETTISHPKGVMVWVAFCSDGFFKPI